MYWYLAEVKALYATKVHRCDRVSLWIGAFTKSVNAALCAEAMIDYVLVEGV